MFELQLATVNCRGLGDLKKRRDVLNFLRNQNYDIIFLQDTHITKKSTHFFNSLWPGKCYHSCHTNRSRGVTILIKQSVQQELIEVQYSECGNFVIVVCKFGTETYLMVSIYGPNEDDPNFYTNLSHTIRSYDTDHVIMAGDFNFVINPSIDSYNYAREYNPNAKRVFLNLVDEEELVDAWRELNPEKSEYTWARNNPIKCGRLDMFFVNANLITSVRNARIKPGYRTDHSIVEMSLHINEIEKGPGLWKFNEAVLKDTEYVDLVYETIRDIVQQYAIPIYSKEHINSFYNYDSVQFTISDSLLYETLLMTIRGETVKYCKRRARKRREKEQELEREINLAYERFNNSKCDTTAKALDNAKKALEEHRKPYIEGLIVRSRTQWHEKGERSTKYFLSLEKRNSIRKTIQYIKYKDKTITRQSKILSLFTNALQEKYRVPKDIEPDLEFIKRNITNTLSNHEKNALEEDLTFQELSTSLRNMKKGKTPGSNGFTVDFYRCFWNPLGVLLHRAVKYCFSQGDIPPTHHESIITLIPKAGKSSHLLQGWRPISLLNVDYKIVSTAIANRFKKVIHNIISPAQSAYIKGRFIGENSRLVYDMVTHVKQNNKQGLILAADFEAAFETISWEYTRAVLNQMNFGKNFIGMVIKMYLNTNNFSRILLNGFLGEKIHINRGIRQGDPVSGFLFNIAVEILTNQIIKSKKLSGIRINSGTEIRISQYADDTILFLDNSERSLIGATEELTAFSSQSGLKLNWNKTSCMSLGPVTNPCVSSNSATNQIKWVDEIKILGIQFKYNIDDITDKNLEPKLVSLAREIKQWERRFLTPIGKITVIKSLLLSKLVHILMSLPNPSQPCIKRIENMFYKFLWNNKPDRVRRTKVVQKYQFDGLKMIDLRAFINSLKVTWLKRLNNQSDWTALSTHDRIDPHELLMYGTAKLKKRKTETENAFWRDVIQALIEINTALSMTYENIITEPLWYSDHTKFRTSKIVSWEQKGLRFIGDLFNSDTGNLLTREEIKTNYRISMTFLCYESLIHSLPSEVRNATNVIFEKPNIPYKIQAVLNKQNSSKYVYDALVMSLNDRHNEKNEKLKQKWIRDVGFYEVGSVMKIRQATKSVYLQYLHYRIINRIISTNKFLNTINKSDSDSCTFCKNDVETITHLFWQCPVTQTFLKDINTHLETNYTIKFPYREQQSWFFLQNNDPLETLLITIAKAVIFRARNSDELPSVEHLIKSVKTEAQKEQHSSRVNNQTQAFEQKWKTLKHILQ